MKKLIKINTVISILFFLFLFVASAFDVKLNLYNLSNDYITSYLYTSNADINTKDKHSFEDPKYTIKEIDIYNSLFNKSYKINVNQTISEIDLNKSMVLENFLIKTNINENNLQIPTTYKFKFLYKIFIFTLIIIFLFNAVCFILKLINVKLYEYFKNFSFKEKKYKFKITYAIVLLIITFTTLILAYLTHFIDFKFYYNIDELFLIDLFNGIMKGNRFLDWGFTNVPFYFPDYPIFLITYLITKDPYWNFLIYSSFQLSLTFFLMLLFIKNFTNNKIALNSAASIIFLWLLLSVFFKDFDSYHETFKPLLLAVFHFGSILNVLIFGIICFSKNNNFKKLYKLKLVLVF